MVTGQTNSGKAKSVIGMVILGVGVLILVPKFIAMIPLLSGTLQEIWLQLFDALPAIGLEALHAGQALAFEPGTFFAGMLRILLSFWPLLVVAVGTLLLRNESGVWSRNSNESSVSSLEDAR
jgi:branched-subunit amino acid transport protein